MFWVTRLEFYEVDATFILKSFTVALERYLENKKIKARKFKGTFFSFHQGQNRRRGQLEYSLQNTLSVSSGTPVRPHLKWKDAVPSPHQKASTLGFGDKRGISECFKTLTSSAREKKKHSTTKKTKKNRGFKEHLPPHAHVVAENAGSPDKQLSSAVRRHRCA